VVVDGEFVIYLDIYEDLDEVLTDMLTTLMNTDHRLDRAHPCVLKVRYIDISTDTISGNVAGDAEQGPQATKNSATLSSSFYALMAGGAFIVIGTAILYRRRRRAAEHDGETSTAAQSAAHLQAPSIQ
jgi:hypothetical protein